MIQPRIWINGEPHAPDTPHISVRDRGFSLADGLFETMRVHGGRVFRLDRHLARLRQGLDALAIPAVADLERWVLDAARDTEPADASLRLTVTRGACPPGLLPPGDAVPTVILVTDGFPVFPDAIYDEGLHARIASGRRNAHAMTAGLKTLAYTEAVAALLEARRAGADDAIFLDTENHCSEATASNLFIRRGSALLTPPLSCAALPGITRSIVMELAAGCGLRASETPFDRVALIEADEAFLTSSLRGIAPVTRLDAQHLGTGAPGDGTRCLSAAYRALVAQECGGAR